MSTDDDKKDDKKDDPLVPSDAERQRGGVEGPISSDPVPQSFEDLVQRTRDERLFVPSEAEGRVEVPAMDPDPPVPPEPAPPPAPVTATTSDLQAAVGVRPSVSPSPSTSAPPSSTRLPSATLSPAPPPPRRPAATFSDADADDEDTTPRSRKWPIAVGLSALVGAVVAAFVLLGNANAKRYYLRCSAKYITAEQGNSFPPWGTSRVSAPGFKPISIPPNAECTPQSTDSLRKLEELYLTSLVDQATRKLSGTSPGDIDAAQTELEQALLLTRSPERRDQRKDLERLLGDVTYWRAAAQVKSAATELEEAAKRFDEASAARPRHASDASEWARFARDTASALSSGPTGAGSPSSPPSGVPLPTRPPAPPGVALPIEMPPPVSAADGDAGVDEPDAARSTLPSGGVLM